MNKKHQHNVLLLAAIVLLQLFLSANIGAQDSGKITQSNLDAAEVKRLETNSQLAELEGGIKAKSIILSKLKAQLKKDIGNRDLELEVARTAQDIDVIKKSFEQVAIGGVSLDVFGEEVKTQDWREELALVIKPLLENLNHLTEKPRKQEGLRRIIDHQENAIESADRAIISLEKLLSVEQPKAVTKQLRVVSEKWLDLKDDAERKHQLADYELANLTEENIHWFTSLMEAVASFARDRGLTILIALFVATLVWLFFRAVRLFFERSKRNKHAKRASYNIIQYAQKLISILLVVISVLVVFFIRGDILLLAIMVILLFAAALGLRSLLPQFIQESRLLLNIGSVRENEHLMFNGVPWRVASINVFSKLINPELHGVLRLPLSDLKGLTSRPIVNEKWFPSSIGDWVVDDANNLYEVIEQTPSAVELQSAQGTNKLVTTDTYYTAGFVNLTRSKQIRITSRFGLDYKLQAIALDVVPDKMQHAVQTYLEQADLGTSDIQARVEFETAGESSLDFIIIVQLGSSAAKSYYRIERCIQQACVQVCNAEGWSIPFPQRDVHLITDEAK